MKIGLYIVNQLHNITQAGFEVRFAPDFEGMMRIDYTKELDIDFYEHNHVGYPGQTRDELEQGIIKSLNKFRMENEIK